MTVGLLGGDPLTPLIAVGLICAVLGGGLSATGEPDGRGRLSLERSVAACLIAACAIATMQVTLHAAGKVNPYWAAEIEHLATATTAAIVVVAIVLRRRNSGPRERRDRLTPRRAQLPMIALAAVTGAGGDLAYAAGSTGALSTVSAIASLYPIPTIALAFAIQHRHTQRAQAIGITLALVGATVLGAASG